MFILVYFRKKLCPRCFIILKELLPIRKLSCECSNFPINFFLYIFYGLHWIMDVTIMTMIYGKCVRSQLPLLCSIISIDLSKTWNEKMIDFWFVNCLFTPSYTRVISYFDVNQSANLTTFFTKTLKANFLRERIHLQQELSDYIQNENKFKVQKYDSEMLRYRISLDW